MKKLWYSLLSICLKKVEAFDKNKDGYTDIIIRIDNKTKKVKLITEKEM